jgi:hypothetical protein
MQVRFAFQKVENRHSANAQQSKILIVGVITIAKSKNTNK